MPVKSVVVDTTGTIGIPNKLIYITTDDSDDVIGEIGYLNDYVNTFGNPGFDNAQLASVTGTDGTSIWDVIVTRFNGATYYSLILNTDGCVTSVTGVSPIVSSGGFTPSISLASKGIGVGSVTNANISYDDKGLITAISSGTADMIPFEVVAADATLEVNHGYFTNSVSLINLTAPASFVISDQIEIANINTGGWKINLNAGQYIRGGNLQTTSGGSLASSSIGDSVRLVAYDANNLIVLSGVTNEFEIL